MKRLLAGSILFLAALGGGSGAPVPSSRATCVFTNPAFAGKCVENADVPAGSSAAQACQQILTCLNDVACLKTYCQATTIRSNWRLESARVEASVK